MKKNPFSYSRTAAAILIIAAITCSIVWLTPSIAGPKKDKTTVTKTAPATITPVATTTAKPAIESTRRITPKPATVPTADMAMNPPVIEENVLIQHLMTDRMVDEVKGFLVERKQDKLFIDGQQQPDEIANKYLSRLEKKEMRVKVYPFNERVKQHPNATLMQLIQPVSFSSECVDSKPKSKKDGC